MKHIFILTILLALVLSLAACSETEAIPSGTWNLVSLNGSTLLPDTQLTIEFTDEQVSGFSGCNTFGGTYTLRGSDLEFAELVTTLMACADTEAMTQESAYFAALQAVASIEFNETTLTLSGEGVELVFTR